MIKRILKIMICLLLLYPASIKAEIIINIDFHKDTFERIEPIEYTVSIHNTSTDTFKIQINRYVDFGPTLEVKADHNDDWVSLWGTNMSLTERCTLTIYDLSPCFARKPSISYLSVSPGEKKQFAGSCYPVFKDKDKNVFESFGKYEIRVSIPIVESPLNEYVRSISDFIYIKSSSREDELILSFLDEEGMSIFDILAPWDYCGIDSLKFDALQNIGLKYPSSRLGRIITLQKMAKEYLSKENYFVFDNGKEIENLNNQLQLLKSALIDKIYDRAILERMIQENLDRGLFVYDSNVYDEVDELLELIEENK